MDNTLTLLAAQYGHRAMIQAHEIYTVVVPPPKNPQRTTTEAISRGEFPVATVKINGRRYVRLIDLAELIDSGTHNPEDNRSHNTEKRRPGRPRKIVGGAP